MKITLKILFVLVLFQGYAQSSSTEQFTLRAIVIDSMDNKPLPFVSVFKELDRKGTITNFEGRMILENVHMEDTLTLTFIGYEKKRVHVSAVNTSDTIYMLREVQLVDQVIVLADDAFLYHLINRSRKTQSKKRSTAKTYLELQTFLNNKQLELFEAYYNGVFEGYDVAEMNMKTARMNLSPVNKRLFASSFDIGEAIYLHKIFEENSYFPDSPFTVRKKDLRKRYSLILSNKYKDEFENTVYVIGFTPKEAPDRNFKGAVWIDSASNNILKINLKITDAAVHPFETIYGDMHLLSNVSLEITKTYRSIDEEMEVNSIDFNYTLSYTQERDATSKVRSQAVLYAYNYKDEFNLPAFEFPEDYYSDYVKLSVFEDNPPFWECLTEFKASPNEEMNQRFLNNPDNISSRDIFSKGFLNNGDDFVLKRVYVPWSSGSRIRLREMADDSTRVEKAGAYRPEGSFATSSVGIYNYNLLVQLYMDINEVCDSLQIITRAVFDPYRSYYRYPLTNRSGAFINIYFDLMEIQRRKLDQTLRASRTDTEQMRKKYEQFIEESDQLCWRYLKEVERGENLTEFEKWNKLVVNELGIDNFQIFNIYNELYETDPLKE